jgi:hypothetical protein
MGILFYHSVLDAVIIDKLQLTTQISATPLNNILPNFTSEFIFDELYGSCGKIDNLVIDNNFRGYFYYNLGDSKSDYEKINRLLNKLHNKSLLIIIIPVIYNELLVLLSKHKYNNYELKLSTTNTKFLKEYYNHTLKRSNVDHYLFYLGEVNNDLLVLKKIFES